MANLKLADLHPIKKKRFLEVYNNFKEEHYETNFLINNILQVLGEQLTTKQISKIFNRSPAGITDVLVELKKRKKIKNFRVKSVAYWTSRQDLIIISNLKNNYLSFLDSPKQTAEFAKYFKVDWKSSFRRSNELQGLNLVRRQTDRKWIKLQTQKKIIAI